MQVSAATYFLFFFNDTATTEIYTLSLHDALPIFASSGIQRQLGLERVFVLATARRGVASDHQPEQLSPRSEEHTSELQSRRDLVCRLLLEKKKKQTIHSNTSTQCPMSRSPAKSCS